MNPQRVDALVDFSYGVLIFVSVVLIAFVGTEVGAAFGFGVLASYGVHVVWKMARFDPDWMTREVTEEVTETVERTVEDQLDEIGDRLEEVNERIDRRPKSEEFDEKIEEVTETVGQETPETHDSNGESPAEAER
ncbi:hypothetical protein [Halalkalicoccus subterraneus]|uniref:hypothetical protein n=1 Tax=Halalkalicoccus subterraneus TaxID=2675002 RepID=UPI000EFC0F72|nr:hypothetical protein [Halalkalicoccus subterraneus]